MDIDGAVTQAEHLLRCHGLVGWRVVIDRAKTRAGVCRFARREIGLSGPLTALHSPTDVRDTILHEIAHALTGPLHRHDAVWRAQAARLGCSTRACLPPEAPRVEAPWVGTCPAGHTVARHRRPSRQGSCSRCSATYDPAHLFDWQFHPSRAHGVSAHGG
jgi:predicted SprT family Zn-dependent metalloprotease